MTTAIEIARRANINNLKESPMTIDLDTMPDAELGALLKKTMRDDLVRALPALRNKARIMDEQAALQDAEQTKADRKANRKVLGAFTVGDLEVPALDLRDLTDLNVVVPVDRLAPYNKARKALTDEGPLDKETTTYERLVAEHKILRRFAKETAKAKPRLKELVQEPSVFVAADLTPEQDAQIATLVKAGFSVKKATKMAKAIGESL